MSSDGTVLNPVLARTKSLYPSNYEAYREQALDRALKLGDVLLHKTEKHITGLSAPNNFMADYIANIITTNHAHHASELSILTIAFKTLNPMLFELMRYKGLRHVAMFATPLFLPPTGNPDFVQPSIHRPISPMHFWQIVTELLDVPRIQVTVHFGREIDLAF